MNHNSTKVAIKAINQRRLPLMRLLHSISIKPGVLSLDEKMELVKVRRAYWKTEQQYLRMFRRMSKVSNSPTFSRLNRGAFKLKQRFNVIKKLEGQAAAVDWLINQQNNSPA